MAKVIRRMWEANFVVPPVTFRLLYGFIVLAHDRRRILHFAVTESPSAHWVGQQLVNAFPFQTPPRLLLRDRDSIYGAVFTQRVRALGMKEPSISIAQAIPSRRTVTVFHGGQSHVIRTTMPTPR